LSVSNGQLCDANTLNGAFVSKTANSTIISQLTLNKSGSGAQITDAQATINNQGTRLTQAEADIDQAQLDITQAQSDIAALQISNPLSNFAATTDPTINDDSGDGYLPGSRWVNVSNGNIFTAISTSLGAAVWERLDKERLAVSFFASLNMGTFNVTDGAYVQIVADSGSLEVKKITSFYPAGSLAFIAVGPAASEVNEFILYPGGAEEFVSIPPNSRISIRLLAGQAAVTSGVLAINFLTEV
jgi:hypothetical protein